MAQKTFLPGLYSSLTEETASLITAIHYQQTHAAEQAQRSTQAPTTPLGLIAARPSRNRKRIDMAMPVVFGMLLLVIGSLGAIVVKFPGVDTLTRLGTEQVGTTDIPLWGIGGIIAASMVLLWLLAASKMLVARHQTASRHSGAIQADVDAASNISDDTAIPAIEHLSLQVQRRQQLRTWLEDDPTLGQLVDQSIAQQVTSRRRQQQLLALLLGITCLLAGWLLAALTPSLAQLLGR